MKERVVKDKQKSEYLSFEEVMSLTSPEDFDGHTDFHKWTPVQRLEWLSQMAQFMYEFKGVASEARK